MSNKIKDALVALAIGACIGLAAVVAFAGYQHSTMIDFSVLDDSECQPWVGTFDGLTVTVASDDVLATKPMGTRHTALTIDGTATITFSPPASYVSIYMQSNSATTKPSVTCYGELVYSDANGIVESPMEYTFGPQNPVPAPRQYSSGTPNNDEFYWDRCEVSGGSFWYFVATK